MTLEPVSRPYNRREGVRSSGRPPAAPRPAPPPLGEEAERLLEVAAAGRLDVLKFAEVMVANPSRAGIKALAHMAWGNREEARKLYPAKSAASSTMFDSNLERAEALEKANKDCTVLLEAKEAEDRFQDTLATSFARVAVAGIVAGRETARKEFEADQPAVVRETRFISDDKGHVTGKTEREFKPTGGKP